jgi:acyl carrier protein
MQPTLSIDDVIAFLEEATQSLPGTLRGPTRLLDLSGWDSMGMVMFMGLVRDKCGVELSVYDLRECATVAELAGAVERRARA